MENLNLSEEERRRLIVRRCIDMDNMEEEQERFKRAIKYKLSECPKEKCEMICWKNGLDDYELKFYENIKDLIFDCLESNTEIPKYVYGTKLEKRKISLNALGIAYNGTQFEFGETIDFVDDEEIDELQDILNKWCEKQEELDVYFVDYDCAILLDELIELLERGKDQV